MAYREIEQWMDEIDKEDERTRKCKAWNTVPKKNAPKRPNPLPSHGCSIKSRIANTEEG